MRTEATIPVNYSDCGINDDDDDNNNNKRLLHSLTRAVSYDL